MIQFQFLSGKMAGVNWTTRRFPVTVGRASANALVLDEAGVWDRHFTLEFARNEGVLLAVAPDAIVRVNQQPVTRVRLRNGDTIEAGAARLQFWLAAPIPRGLRWREWWVWALIAGVCLGQMVLIYRVLP